MSIPEFIPYPFPLAVSHQYSLERRDRHSPNQCKLTYVVSAEMPRGLNRAEQDMRRQVSPLRLESELVRVYDDSVSPRYYSAYFLPGALRLFASGHKGWKEDQTWLRIYGSCNDYNTGYSTVRAELTIQVACARFDSLPGELDLMRLYPPEAFLAAVQGIIEQANAVGRLAWRDHRVTVWAQELVEQAATAAREEAEEALGYRSRLVALQQDFLASSSRRMAVQLNHLLNSTPPYTEGDRQEARAVRLALNDLLLDDKLAPILQAEEAVAWVNPNYSDAVRAAVKQQVVARLAEMDALDAQQQAVNARGEEAPVNG